MVTLLVTEFFKRLVKTKRFPQLGAICSTFVSDLPIRY